MRKRVRTALATCGGLSLFLAALVFAAAPAFAAKIATVNIPVQTDLYSVTPPPLTPTQCAQCHTTAFGSLKTNGGKHRFGCQQCHQSIHAYNPKKGGWDALMPKCSSCHTEIHGPANKDCSSCHADPHAPRRIPMITRLTGSCATCHVAPKADLTKFPSKHSLLACEKCHTSHGFKPACSACHKPHFQGQLFNACIKCHPVHKPKQISYGATEPAITCGSCHSKAYWKWKKTPSRHAKVNCAVCHQAKHGYIPLCIDCHKAPHPKSILDRFPKCLNCHIDVHDLPSRN